MSCNSLLTCGIKFGQILLLKGPVHWQRFYFLNIIDQFRSEYLMPVLWYQQDVFLCTKTSFITLQSRVLTGFKNPKGSELATPASVAKRLLAPQQRTSFFFISPVLLASRPPFRWREKMKDSIPRLLFSSRKLSSIKNHKERDYFIDLLVSD